MRVVRWYVSSRHSQPQAEAAAAGAPVVRRLLERTRRTTETGVDSLAMKGEGQLVTHGVEHGGSLRLGGPAAWRAEGRSPSRVNDLQSGAVAHSGWQVSRVRRAEPPRVG
jgi:hypothetical protein